MSQSPLDEELKFDKDDIIFVVKLLGGFILIILGLVGLAIPYVPDVIFIIIGIFLMDVTGSIRNYLVGLFPKKWQKKLNSVLFVTTKPKGDK